ncbi:hypothetical protein [Sandaracinus amylolyticus]|uniref:DUF2029 domain-containing protein n=1 Tax=Sandaracinus amylolyticus TaxID=927083 RepID=A0A0F6YJT6_9BACT|nr:hypothetical protein [Sandaracinus amylolyticus]AKF08195.1 hypothetical protein DB32_005344 [Sandaracinus amylolyticus]
MTPRRLAYVAALATAALLIVAALGAIRGARASDVVLAIAAAFVPYAGLVWWRLHDDAMRATHVAIGIALVAGLALVCAPPLLSDDVYRYLWDARVLRNGIDPYAYPPTDPALIGLRDALHARINHPDLPTIYPPLAQIVFVIADAIAHAPWSMKLVALIAHLATTLVVARLAPERAPLHALNPLALEEAALGGHVDAFAGLFLVLAVLAMARSAWSRAALAIASATAIKLVGLVLVPLLALAPRARGAIAISISIIVGVSVLAPVSLAGHARDDTSGLGHYARRWRGNEGGFVVLAEGSRLALEGLGRVSGAPPGWIRLPFLAPVIARVRGTPLDPRATMLAPKKEVQRPTSFETRHLGDLLARGLALLLVLAVAIAHVRKGSAPLRAARDVVLALLLVAPQVHPWYLAWLLPLEVASGRATGLVWSASMLVAYAPIDVWLVSGTWQESPIARVLEYTFVIVVLCSEHRSDFARTPV